MNYAESYFDGLAELYTIPNPLPLFLEWNFGKILDRIPDVGDLTVLDLGTGNGVLLARIGRHNPDSKLIGVDFSQGMLDQARKNLGVGGLDAQLIKSDLIGVPLETGSIDFVVSNNTLHHVEDKGALYSEIYRLLKPAGVLVYSDSHDAPDRDFDQEKLRWLERDREFAVRYKESADNFWQALPDELKQDHPEEYHYPFSKVVKFLDQAGFSTPAIVPSPSYFAIVSAPK